jgi:hypothetical protein
MVEWSTDLMLIVPLVNERPKFVEDLEMAELLPVTRRRRAFNRNQSVLTVQRMVSDSHRTCSHNMVEGRLFNDTIPPVQLRGLLGSAECGGASPRD